MLDTHEFVKAMKAAGFPEIQAEALMMQLRKAEESTLENLATKQDILELRSEIRDVRGEIKDVRTELKQDMQELRNDIKNVRAEMREMELRVTIKLGAMMAASIAIVAALVKLL